MQRNTAGGLFTKPSDMAVVSYYYQRPVNSLDHLNLAGIHLPQCLHFYHIVWMTIGIQGFLEVRNLVEITGYIIYLMGDIENRKPFSFMDPMNQIYYLALGHDIKPRSGFIQEEYLGI